jgi:hypothetical protein
MLKLKANNLRPNFERTHIMSIEYMVQKETKATLHGKVIKAKVSGTSFRILLTPLEGIADYMGVSVYDTYTLVTLLEHPWTSYPFALPLPDYFTYGYLLEKLYASDPLFTEEARKLCYLLKSNTI